MFKLQISCIIILGFLLFLFLSERKLKKGTEKLYVAVLIVSMLEILFEVIAIYSIVHIDHIAPFLFKSIHRSYLTLVLTFFYLNFRYKSTFVREQIGNPERGLAFIHVAQVILYAGIFLLPLGYEVKADGPEFSYGPGVWAVYVGAAFYLFVIFSNYCEQLRKIKKEALLPLVLGVGIGMITCFVYMYFPASNISGLGIVVVNIAMYISIHASEVNSDGKKEAEKEDVLPERVVRHVSFEAPNARVLIVDDSEMNRKVLKNLLQKTKMQIDEAAGGRECLELVRKNKYHLIFMDHLMPEMDGLETFEALKDEHLCDNIPVMVMTANTLSMTEEDYLGLGFCAYMAKPVLPEKLDALVYKVLDKSLMASVETKEIALQETDAPSGPVMEEQPAIQESWDELPVVDGLDYSYAALHFQSPTEFSEMVCFLVEVMQPDMKELKTYCDEQGNARNLNDFRTKVHSMKNSAMTIGVVPLAGLAKTLEEAAKDGNTEQIRILLPVFEEKWEKYRVLLSGKFSADSADKISADPSSEEIQELFLQLRDAAEEMDIDALDAIMNRIDGYAFPPEYDEKLQQIRLAVMNFDIDYLQKEGYLER